ncbi:MAG: hypothetical protein ACYC1D_02420 [Acidimicrobiales bacterium]
MAMFLPSLAETAAALVGATRPWWAGIDPDQRPRRIAMRAGMRRDSTAALAGFDARYYTNRLGLGSVRGDEPAEVRSALAEAGARTLAWYGVRLFSDHWDSEDSPADLDALLGAEEQAGRRRPLQSARRSHSHRCQTGIAGRSSRSRQPIPS